MIMKSNKAYIFNGMMNYLVHHNINAGRQYVYNIYLLTPTNPITIGREISLKLCKELIVKYEQLAKEFDGFYGATHQIKDIIKILKKARLKRN